MGTAQCTLIPCEMGLAGMHCTNRTFLPARQTNSEKSAKMNGFLGFVGLGACQAQQAPMGQRRGTNSSAHLCISSWTRRQRATLPSTSAWARSS